MQKVAICTTLSGYVFATKACIDNQKKKTFVFHVSPQFGKLWPTNSWNQFRSLFTPADFNGFRVLHSLLQRRRLEDANQTLHGVWPSPALVHYIYTFSGALSPWQNFARYKIHFTSKSCIRLYWQHYCTALQQWASAKLHSVPKNTATLFFSHNFGKWTPIFTILPLWDSVGNFL